MATKRKTIDETRRPWRAAGEELREWICCPLCRVSLLKVVAYRANTVRFECSKCGLRFSLRPLDVADTLRLRPALVAASMSASADEHRLGSCAFTSIRDRAVRANGERFAQASPGDRVRMMLQVLRDAGTRIALGALARADDTADQRKQLLQEVHAVEQRGLATASSRRDRTSGAGVGVARP
jgi:hypothetical protein